MTAKVRSYPQRCVDSTDIDWSTNKLKRVARNSLCAEIQQACNTDDELYTARLLRAEINGMSATRGHETEAVKQIPGILVIDAKGVCDALHNSSSTALGLTEKRSGIELLGLRESVEEFSTDVRWTHSDGMIADGMTKGRMAHRVAAFIRNPKWKLIYDSTFTSAKKRRELGLRPLDDNLSPGDRQREHNHFIGWMFHMLAHEIMFVNEEAYMVSSRSTRTKRAGTSNRMRKRWQYFDIGYDESENDADNIADERGLHVRESLSATTF